VPVLNGPATVATARAGGWEEDARCRQVTSAGRSQRRP
jgi:hypothetical protein